MDRAIGEWTLRSFADSDAEALVRQADSWNVARHLRDRFPHPYTHAHATEWIAFARAQTPEVNFAIAGPDGLVGGIGLMLQDDIHRRTAEIGYWLGEEYWGRGIATLAVRALSEWAFERFELVRLHAWVFAGNPASARVLEKAGYALEARLKKSAFKEGRDLDQLLYALVR